MPSATLVPDAPGTYNTNDTPVGEATAWQCLDDDNGDTSYVRDTTPGNQIQVSTTFTNLGGAVGDIVSVTGIIKINPITGIVPRQCSFLARLGGVDQLSASKAIPSVASTYGQLSFVGLSKPGGGDWSVTDINNAEFGFSITQNTGDSDGLRVSYIAVTVVYAELNWGGSRQTLNTNVVQNQMLYRAATALVNIAPVSTVTPATPLDTGWAQQGGIHFPAPIIVPPALPFLQLFKGASRGIVVPWDNRTATPKEET